MQKEDHTEDVDLSQENNEEQSEGTEVEPTEEGQQDADNGDEQDSSKDGENYRAQLNQTNRFLKREGYEFVKGQGWVKKAAPTSSGKKEQTHAPANGLSRDEAILIAQGLSVEELDKAKKIADLEDIALLDVPKNDLFTTWKEKRDKEAKAQAAQLGASRGSRVAVKKGFTTPGLSDEDHKALFNDKVGR